MSIIYLPWHFSEIGYDTTYTTTWSTKHLRFRLLFTSGRGKHLQTVEKKMPQVTCQSEAFAGTSTISPAWSCKTSSTKYNKRRTGIAGDAALPSILGQHSSDKIDKLVVLLAFTVDRRFGSLERIFHILSLGFSSLSLNYTTVLHRSQIKDEQSVTMKL